MGNRIRGARTGTVSSVKSARDTAADVVFYDEDDSGLQFKNRRTERAYNRAKKRYERKRDKQTKEQEILSNPKEHFNEYIALKRDKDLEAAAPMILAVNPVTIGLTAASAAASIPATVLGVVGGTIGGNIGANKGREIDERRHNYTNNETTLGLVGSTIGSGIGAGIGLHGEQFVTSGGQNWLTHNFKNFSQGFRDFLKYGNKETRGVIKNGNHFEVVTPETYTTTTTMPEGIVDFGNGTGGVVTTTYPNMPTLKVIASDTGGRVTVTPKTGGSDYAIAIPNKQALRWAYRTVSDIAQPGDYIGNDSPYSPLGRQLRIAKTLSNNPIEFAENLARAMASETGEPKGYSPDSYAQILKAGHNPRQPYVLRYASKPSSRFNNMGQSPLASEIAYKQEFQTYNPEMTREFVKFVNDNLIIPNGGEPGWVGIDGRPKFPHPYLMRK